MRHNILFTDEGKSVIVLLPSDGDPQMVTETHPNYLRIVQALKRDEDPTEFLDPTVAIERVVANLSARVSVIDGVLHFDGDPVFDGLSATIERYYSEGREATNLVRFMERLSANPVAHSREQLFTWTEAQSLTIDNDGYIIGYKGVYSRDDDQDYLDDDGQPLFPIDKYPYRSSSAGHGIVDGIEVSGYLPMGVGVTVEMPRDEVNHDPAQGCSTGLHVGTYDYAKGYSQRGALLEVRFDPADVVSVPTDCGYAKLRCCRYEGAAIHDEDLGDDLSAWEPDATWDSVEALDEITSIVPEGWFDRFRARISRKGK